MADIQSTQDVIEVAYGKAPSVAATQDVLEFAWRVPVNNVATQDVIEIIWRIPGATGLLSTWGQLTGTGTVEQAPLPSLWLDLWVWRVLTHFESVDQVIAFPPGYEQVMRLALAVELCRIYPMRNPGPVRERLARALQALEQGNLSNAQATEELPPPETPKP